jgi:hypothetical protein
MREQYLSFYSNSKLKVTVEIKHPNYLMITLIVLPSTVGFEKKSQMEQPMGHKTGRKY